MLPSTVGERLSLTPYSHLGFTKRAKMSSSPAAVLGALFHRETSKPR